MSNVISNKKIVIQYYAILREQRKANEEMLETTARTARELFEQLKRKYNFSLSINSLKVAINDEFADWDSQIKSGDHVVFIPPVAGG